MRALAAVVFLVACSKSTQDGLPPATEWQTGEPGAATGGAMPNKPRGVPSSDPHAGMLNGTEDDSGGDPHAGVPGAPPMGGGQAQPIDPHAGVPGAPPIGAGATAHSDPNNPHGDVGAAVDVTSLGFSSPDPNRAIDPGKRVRGTIKLDAKIRDRVKPGAAVFLMIRRAGPDGKPTGMPLAVDKVTWGGDALAFELSEKQAMVSVTQLTGDVVVMARFDQDTDALTKQPGDVTGMTRTTIPSDNVAVTLDTILQ
ncbi:MAG: hypothetical protein ABI867_09520 [Kofleriaceae bacterium]